MTKKNDDELSSIQKINFLRHITT